MPKRSLRVHLLPKLFEPAEIAGGVAVIVDVLRASTTISFALANGAAAVVPCETVETAQQVRASAEQGHCLLGGERGGLKIEGFDLSNSPDDYVRSIVEGRLIGFTTTNGTMALLRASQADVVMIGAFVNLSAVAERILADSRPIHIVCAGTNGQISGEDVLFAGALAERLTDTESCSPCDSADIAISHWRQECGDGSRQAIETALRRSQGGRNLIDLKYDKDIATAAMVDELSNVGVLADDGRLR